MKKNTRKLLLSLYSPQNKSDRGVDGFDSSRGRVKMANLKIVTPDLTDGGRRSLLHVLKANGLINSERVLGETSIGITRHGIIALEAQFPALSLKWDGWQGNWDCLVFVKAPKSDKQFRYLRTLLVTERAISISRGVYISPFSFSDKVMDECREIYRDSILIFSISEWKLANLRSLIIEKYGMVDLIESYSGVSKEINGLLESMSAGNKFTHRQKTDINLVYDRLIDVLSEDPGFCRYYFNEVPNIRKMLLSFNSIISRR